MLKRTFRWRRWTTMVGVLVLIPLAFGAGRLSNAGPGASILSAVFQIVSMRAIDSLPEDSVYIRAATGLVNSLNDPYASLWNRKESSDFMRNVIGNAYGGLGMGLNQEDSNVVVNDVFPMSPAEKGGVERGDIILRIDTASTAGWPIDKVASHLVGQIGTPVTVTFGRAGARAPVVQKFMRAQVHALAVPYTLVLDDHVGYIPLQRFNATAGAEVADAVKKLQAQGVTRFLLDLRGNGGGDVDQAIQVSNVFLAQGMQVAVQRERGVAPKIWTANGPATAASSSLLAVMVDGGTASASEIVAGSLQDHDRALILGTTTFGKGLVQGVYGLDAGYAIKLTTGKWYTPSGRSIHRDRVLKDGRLVLADSGGDTTAAQVMHSDAGRKLLARGGISPDVNVEPDTITAPEQALVRVLVPKAAEYRAVIFETARDLAGKATPTFTVTAEIRDNLRQKLKDSGITFTDQVFQAGSHYLDEALTIRTLRFAFGDSTAVRRSFSNDAVVKRASGMFKKAGTEMELLKGGI